MSNKTRETTNTKISQPLRKEIISIKILRVCLHSFILAIVNVGSIITGFRIYHLLANQIVIQAPFSGMLCIITFVIWNLFVRYLPFKELLLQGKRELAWVYVGALLWSPIIFIPLHSIRWGYLTSPRDILSIWVFQLLVNFLITLVILHFFPFGHKIGERIPSLWAKWSRFPLANLILVVMSSIFSVGLAEFMLQAFYNPPPIISGWRSLGSTFEKNQLGFRGQSIEYSDDDFVIVLIGDSQVAAIACAYGWMPERRLQHHLNSIGKRVKVFTLGAGGYGQDQQLLVLQEYYQTYRADMVILWQTPGNDIWNNMFPTHWPVNGMPKPTFWLENGELRGPSEQMGETIKTSSIKLIALWQHIFTPLDRDRKWVKYLPEPYSPMVEYDGPVNMAWQERWDANLGLPDLENLDTEKSHLTVSLTPRSKRMEYGLELTRRLLQKIDKLVTSHNGKFVLFRTNLPSKHKNPDENVYVLNGKYYKTSRKQFESNVHYINQNFQTYLIPVTVEDWRVGPLDGHLNEHAVDQVMKDLANALKNLIPPSLHTSEN